MVADCGPKVRTSSMSVADRLVQARSDHCRKKSWRECGPWFRNSPLLGRVISVDTMRADVAEAGLDAGATIVNDVSGGLADPRMLEVVARRGALYIGLRIANAPSNRKPKYSADSDRRRRCRSTLCSPSPGSNGIVSISSNSRWLQCRTAVFATTS
jgi:hypothetical protein